MLSNDCKNHFSKTSLPHVWDRESIILYEHHLHHLNGWQADTQKNQKFIENFDTTRWDTKFLSLLEGRDGIREIY